MSRQEAVTVEYSQGPSTLEGRRHHRGPLIVFVAFCCGMLSFGIHLGMMAINTCFLEGHSLVSVLVILPFTTLPLVWSGAKIMGKAFFWSDQETQNAIQRDRLREAREGLVDSVFGTPYAIFLVLQ